MDFPQDDNIPQEDVPLDFLQEDDIEFNSTLARTTSPAAATSENHTFSHSIDHAFSHQSMENENRRGDKRKREIESEESDVNGEEHESEESDVNGEEHGSEESDVNGEEHGSDVNGEENGNEESDVGSSSEESDDDDDKGEYVESAVHKLNSKITPEERRESERKAKISAYTYLTSGAKFSKHQRQLLLAEHRNDVSMRRRNRRTEVQRFYEGESDADEDAEHQSRSRKDTNLMSLGMLLYCACDICIALFT